MIVLGQSGAGKTTLVDAYVNYLMGIEIYDKFRYKIVDARAIEKERRDVLGQGKSVQTMSQTSSVGIYHVPAEYIVNGLSSGRHCVNIIDTPGFGDTRGVDWDYKIFEMIKSLL